jgi:hypothetical protein
MKHPFDTRDAIIVAVIGNVAVVATVGLLVLLAKTL